MRTLMGLVVVEVLAAVVVFLILVWEWEHDRKEGK